MTDTNHPRRSFLGTAVAIAAVANLGAMGVANARTGASSTRRLEPLQHVDAGVLNIAYYEAGPADGPAVMLMHGYPYDVHSYVDVAPRLGSPWLQGHRSVSAGLHAHALPR